jgi:transcriptional regulator with XRE-family HTH domain
MHIGQEIKNKRMQLKLTQKQLAHKLNVSRTAVSNWEQRKNYPDIEMLVLISDVLDISLDKLLRGDQAMIKKIDSNLHKKKFYKVLFEICLLIFLLLTSTWIWQWTIEPSVFSPNELKITHIAKVTRPGRTINGRKTEKDYSYEVSVKSNSNLKTFSNVRWSSNNYDDKGKVLVLFQAKNSLNIFSNSQKNNRITKLKIPCFSGESTKFYNIKKDIYVYDGNTKNSRLILSKNKN